MLTAWIAMVAVSTTPTHRPPLTLITSITDGTFANADWTYTDITYGPGCTLTRSTPASPAGNPYPCRRNLLTWAPPKSYYARGAILALKTGTGGSWTPTTSPTPFASLTVTWDEYQITTIGHLHQLLIYQDGKYYIGPDANTYIPMMNVWYTGTRSGIVAADFWELNTTTLDWNTASNPNFTTGGTMTFGYIYLGIHQVSGAKTEGTMDFDNYDVDLYRS